MTFKKELVKQGVLDNRCYNEDCSIQDTWNGKAVTLQLHHKDGDSSNDSPENLELLCPNCHSQTDSYAGKNKKHKAEKLILEISIY